MIDIKFFIIILYLWFLPEIIYPFFRLIFCRFKRRSKSCYKCYFWDCPKYNTCYFNSKTLLDFPGYHFRLCDGVNFVTSLFHMIIIILFTIILWLVL